MIRFIAVLVVSALVCPAPLLAAAAAPKTRLTAREAEALVKEMSGVVERIRGLKFKTPVTMEIIDGATARANFKSKVEPRDEEQMRHAQHAYVHLGLVPPSADLLTEYLDLAETGVDGYYEPGTKTFYLLDHVSPDDVRAVMAHELTHALEDQHFDLKALSKVAGGDDDRSTALSALIEGSAMVVMLTYLDQEMRKGKAVFREVEKNEEKRADRLKVAPSFTQRSLLLPYLLGFTFLLRGDLYNWFRGGVLNSDLDYAYAHPPLSTRHILHPRMYWRLPGKKFTPPTLPDMTKLLGEGWQKASEGSIGELGLGVLTGVQIDFAHREILRPSKWTNTAAAGTVGDAFQHYVNGDRRLTVLVAAFESVAQVNEFERAMRPTKGKRYYVYGANFVVLSGDFGEKADALASAAFEGSTYWPRDESLGKWPPDEGPSFWLGD